MKELSIEEKAQRYDEALETARKINSGEGVPKHPGWTVCEVIFPELKENKIKDIRKQLIKAFGSIGKKEWGGVNVKDAIAWLEKQGEQKPVWSEEDENHIIGITQTIDGAIRHNVISHKTGDMQITWIKSLKERYTWEPSDEQIKALSAINVTGAISYVGQGQELINLYNDLKKLKDKVKKRN